MTKLITNRRDPDLVLHCLPITRLCVCVGGGGGGGGVGGGGGGKESLQTKMG